MRNGATMKAILAATAALATILTATSASAERWAVVGIQSADQKMSAIDLATIRDVGAYKRAWLLIVLGTAPDGIAYYTQELTEFDCAAQRLQSVAVKLFKENGEFSKELGSDSWSYPAPNSAGFVALEYACGVKVDEARVVTESAFEMFKTFMEVAKKKSSKR